MNGILESPKLRSVLGANLLTGIKKKEDLKIKDIAWAAGFLEGEGHFRVRKNRTEIGATQRSIEPLRKLQKIFGGQIKKRKGETTNFIKNIPYIRHDWRICGSKAAIVMITIYSFMSSRRKERIKDALLIWEKAKIEEKYRTHCIHGHPFNEKNTWVNVKHGSRQCRECNRIRSYNRRHKQNVGRDIT